MRNIIIALFVAFAISVEYTETKMVEDPDIDSEELEEVFEEEPELEDSMEMPEVNTMDENNPPLPSVRACSDGRRKCPNWAAQGLCKYEFYQNNCKKSCGKCGGGGSSCGKKIDLNPSTIVNEHNDWRSKVALGQIYSGVKATNMRKITWDSQLAAKAQEWANKCKYPGHSPKDFTANLCYPSCGENIKYFNGRNVKGDIGIKAVDAWAAERKYFNGLTGIIPFFNSGHGHWTQMIWADTHKVGCGATLYRGGRSAIVVCMYKKAGNWPDAYGVFKRGNQCSACTKGCDRGLCL